MITKLLFNSINSFTSVNPLLLVTPCVKRVAGVSKLECVIVCTYGPGIIGEVKINSSAFLPAALIVAYAYASDLPTLSAGTPDIESSPAVLTKRLVVDA